MSERVVWKFEIEPRSNLVPMPPRSVPLHVAAIDGRAQVWALVDPAVPREDWVERRLWVVLTGSSPPPGVYLGTFIINEPVVFVGHVFDGGDAPP